MLEQTNVLFSFEVKAIDRRRRMAGVHRNMLHEEGRLHTNYAFVQSLLSRNVSTTCASNEKSSPVERESILEIHCNE